MSTIKKKASKEVYSQFLIGTQGRYSSTFLADSLEKESAHDTFSRWLSTTRLQPHIVWEYSKDLVKPDRGSLIIDDTVIDKWHADEEKMGLVTYQYSGLHHRVVKGIGVVSCLWTSDTEGKGLKGEDLTEHIITDFRIYFPKHDGKTKNDHARDMIKLSHQRGFNPKAVIMDAGYADVTTCTLLGSFGWNFICGLEKNRLVSILPHEHTSMLLMWPQKKVSFVILKPMVKSKYSSWSWRTWTLIIWQLMTCLYLPQTY